MQHKLASDGLSLQERVQICQAFDSYSVAVLIGEIAKAVSRHGPQHIAGTDASCCCVTVTDIVTVSIR
jgi:hypothetical protein